MRIVLALLMCWGVAFGQDTTKYFKSVDYGWNWQRGKFRGGLILPTDTTNNKLGIAQIGATCFAWSGTKWNSIGSTDTSFLVRYYRKNQVDSAIAANTPALTLQDVTTNGKTTTDSIIAASFKITGGTSSQFLKANGSVDNSTYLTSASLTGYVPYTGATSDVDLGAFALNAASVKINGTNGSGHIHLRHQASDATSTGQSTTIFANSNGDLKWKNAGNYYTTLQTYNNTANRVYTYQNKSYTLADSTTLADSVSALRTAVNTKGSGTITSIATGLGLSGGTITLNGTLIVDTASTSIISRQRAANTYLPLTGGTLTSRVAGTSLILNKDSLPTVTGKKWGLVIDTANSNRISRQVLSTQIDSIVKSFSPTITFTGTTAPSGTETHTYSWQRRGNQVTVICNLKWTVAGSSVSQILFNLPSDLPTPAIPNGYVNDDVLYTAFANMTNSNNTNLVGSSSGAASIQYQSSVAKFIVRTSGNALRSVQFIITYYTN
jgi:hypothetical protein